MNVRVASIAILSGFFLGTPSLAAPLPLTGAVSTNDCRLLVEPVHIMISKGVKATYVCNDQTSVIGYAACHIHGRRFAVLSDGGQTSNGIVYTQSTNRDGGRMLDRAGCPVGDAPIPDELIDTGVE